MYILQNVMETHSNLPTTTYMFDPTIVTIVLYYPLCVGIQSYNPVHWIHIYDIR
jgi:hypothetical protein